jgi:hypothetical protein
LKPFDVFICHKKSSGKDFAEHLKSGLEELGYHAFLDSKDIPKLVDGREEWIRIRDDAIKESRVFILIITPGFDLSQEVRREIELGRKFGKHFIYFRHRDLARKITVGLSNEKVDLGKQEQVSFETKEELVRLAYNILSRENKPQELSKEKVKTATDSEIDIVKKFALPHQKATISTPEKQKQDRTNKQAEAKPTKLGLICEMCSKPIEGQPTIEQVNGKTHTFDSKECVKTYKKLKSVYGEKFE